MKTIPLDPTTLELLILGTKIHFKEKMNPQPEKIYDGMYCDPYNGRLEYFTFWTKDHKICLFEGNVKNTAHWKPDYSIGETIAIENTKLFAKVTGIIVESGGNTYMFVYEIQRGEL